MMLFFECYPSCHHLPALTQQDFRDLLIFPAFHCKSENLLIMLNVFLLHSSVSAFDQSCTVKFNSPQLLQSDSKQGGRTMSGAAQVIEKVCELSSLFK